MGPSIPFRDAIRFWLKLGFISFGGPAGQIAIMHQELVERRRWIPEQQFLHALNYCMLLPGPEAQQLATYLGWLMHRTWGGILAGVLFVLPSLLILIAMSWLYVRFGQTPLVAGLFYGIKPAVVAIVLHAAFRIGGRVLTNGWLWSIAIAAFVALSVLRLPFPLVIATAAAIGYLGGRLAPERFQTTEADVHQAGDESDSDTINSVVPATTRMKRLAVVVVVGMLLWIIPFSLLLFWFGWSGTLTQMAWFFTKAAFLTFGGAYAVLPYVYQGAVTHYEWLSATQMIDGLALGESTPGPLIMIVSYVGFLGGYLKSLFGPQHQFLAGATAAMVVTWFTFLPSFLFILAGAPIVESTRNQLQVTTPLTAITAAIVGVIVNLAFFFAMHVWWPAGVHEGIDVLALLITTAALLALFQLRRTVLEVIGGGAILGLAMTTLQIG